MKLKLMNSTHSLICTETVTCNVIKEVQVSFDDDDDDDDNYWPHYWKAKELMRKSWGGGEE